LVSIYKWNNQLHIIAEKIITNIIKNQDESTLKQVFQEQKLHQLICQMLKEETEIAG